jgi:hypothetical protein
MMKNKYEIDETMNLKNLSDFFDGFIMSVEDVIYYTGLSQQRAEEVYETIHKIRQRG